jgi:hypothetical protein
MILVNIQCLAGELELTIPEEDFGATGRAKVNSDKKQALVGTKVCSSSKAALIQTGSLLESFPKDVDLVKYFSVWQKIHCSFLSS